MGSYRGVPTKPLGTHPLKDAAFDLARMPPARRELWRRVEASFQEPFIGVTIDGTVRERLRSLGDDDFDPGPVTVAAADLLAALTPEQRTQVQFDVDAVEWRKWTNAFATWTPHGLLLRDVGEDIKEAVVAVLRAALSEAGHAVARDCMRLNGTLAELYGDHENLGEWTYRFAIFGEPSETEPWGWQFHGHHVDLSFLVVGRQVSLAPVFLGAEPSVADGGAWAGVRAFDAEHRRALELRHALTPVQADEAVLFGSMRQADLPPHLDHPTEGRQRAGAGQDNLVLPYEGLCGGHLSAGQRGLLLRLADVYVSRWPAGPARSKMREVERHLDETWFAWIGGDSPCYYRVHSPVLLIEFDHHRGIFLDNPEPEPFHVHTIVRTPNGGDYGRDLLQLHYERHHGTRPAPSA